jgi:hypothetical protein
MYGSKWNMSSYTLIGRDPSDSHMTMTCWLAYLSTSLKKWFQAPSMSLNVCKSHKTTFERNGDGWMCEGILVSWFSLLVLWRGGLDTLKLATSNMFWWVLWPSILMSTLLSHCCAWSSELNTYVTVSPILLPIVVVASWLINWVSLVIWFANLGSSYDTSTMDTSSYVLACHLLGDGSTFDFGTFGPNNFGAPFLWSML